MSKGMSADPSIGPCLARPEPHFSSHLCPDKPTWEAFEAPKAPAIPSNLRCPGGLAAQGAWEPPKPTMEERWVPLVPLARCLDIYIYIYMYV